MIKCVKVISEGRLQVWINDDDSLRLPVNHDHENGFFITAAELEQREREAFESGHKAKVREEYNSTLIKNGFVSAAGRYRDVDEAFEDYMSSKEAK